MKSASQQFSDPASVFIPHGARCEADDGRGSDFGQCSEAASRAVLHRGLSRYVCAFHHRHYKHPDAHLGAVDA